jgi:hypothetical protein
LLGPIAGPFDLATGAVSAVFQAVSDPIVGETTNIADVICLDQLEGDVTDDDTVTVNSFDPSILVEKVCTPELQPAPGTIDWTITVTNTSNDATLFGVVLEDIELGINQSLGDLAPSQVVIVDVQQTGLAAGTYVNTASANGVDQLENPLMDDATATCEVEQQGTNGCTPGFWKNNADKKDYAAWPDSAIKNFSFSSVFDRVITIDVKGKGNTITDPTLEQALGATGGDVNALARHGVAAYLNSIDDEVPFPISTANVIAWVQEAIDEGDFEEHKSILADANELGCSQNQQGEPIDPE